MITVTDFPDLQISEQLFHVPGQAISGGFTTGGARISSPEPGGYGVLELKPSLHVREVNNPFHSWIMSAVNGEVFRVKLTQTPQLISDPSFIPSILTSPWDDGTPFDDGSFWDNSPRSFNSAFTEQSLNGSSQMTIDASGLNGLLKPGHVIGHDDHAYIVIAVEYVGVNALLTVKPPVRSQINIGDPVEFTPYFTGSIRNANEIRSSFAIANNRHHELGTIIFDEVVL